MQLDDLLQEIVELREDILRITIELSKYAHDADKVRELNNELKRLLQ